MGIKRKIRLFNSGRSKFRKSNSFFFSASLLPPPKKPKLFHFHSFSPPRKRQSCFWPSRPSLPPLLPTPHPLSCLNLRYAHLSWPEVLWFSPNHSHCYSPNSHQYQQIGGTLYSQSILGKPPTNLRHHLNQSNHLGVFNISTGRKSLHSARPLIFQGAHIPSHLSTFVKNVQSQSSIDQSPCSKKPSVPRCYTTQELLDLRFHSLGSKEIQQVCARTNFLLDGSRPKARTHHPLDPLPQRGHRKRYRSKDNDALSGNSKRFRSFPNEIGRPLFVFQANSLKQLLKISSQGKRRFFFYGKGQPLKRQKLERPGGVVKKNSPLQDMLAIPVQEIGQKKRQRPAKGGSPFSHSKRHKSAPPGADLLSSVFALTFLYIFSLWRLLLYNSRNGRGGSSALSRHAPSPSGSSEVVPQQPSSHP